MQFMFWRFRVFFLFLPLAGWPWINVSASEEEDTAPLMAFIKDKDQGHNEEEDDHMVTISLKPSVKTAQPSRPPVSLSTAGRIPSSVASSSSVSKGADFNTLFRTLGMYSTLSPKEKLPNDMGVFTSLPPGVQADLKQVAVIDEESMKKHYPYLNAALLLPGRTEYTVSPDRLAKRLYTLRVLRSLDQFCQYQIDVKKVEAGAVAKFMRVLFASMADIAILPLENKGKAIGAILHFWNQRESKAFKINTTFVHEMMEGVESDQAITVFQNLLRYKGVEALRVIIPDTPNSLRYSIRQRFPMTYVLVQMLEHPDTQIWWARNYQQQYLLSTKYSQDYIGKNVISKIESRGKKLNAANLVEALKNRLTPQLGISAKAGHFYANAMIYALYRQRTLIYNLTRPFYPGITRPEAFKEIDAKNIKALSGADENVEYLLKEFDLQANKYGDIVADAYMALLEMPMMIFPLEATLRYLDSAGGDKSAIFQWLATIPEQMGVSLGLYSDYAHARWSAVHFLADMKNIRPANPEKYRDTPLDNMLAQALKGLHVFPEDAPAAGCFFEVLTRHRLDVGFYLPGAQQAVVSGAAVSPSMSLDEQMKQLTLQVAQREGK